MSSTFFIHGFCSEVAVLLLGINTQAGSEFRLFTEANKKDTYVFKWAVSARLSWLQICNPWSYVHLYQMERKKAASAELLDRLHAEIMLTQPNTVFAHSMGCFVWISYIEKYGIPPFVKRILFVQADIDVVLPPLVEQELESQRLQIENYYCFWDQALLCSLLLHRSRRAGLTGIISQHVANKFYPLVKLWNLHTASLRESSFYTTICELK